jgi:hypothetical protein
MLVQIQVLLKDRHGLVLLLHHHHHDRRHDYFRL